MSQPITLYTAACADPTVQWLADQLRRQGAAPVLLLPLSALPAPDTARPTRQQLLNEKYGLECQLEAVQFLLTEFERQPERHVEKLKALRAERALYHTRLGEIAQLRAQAGGKPL